MLNMKRSSQVSPTLPFSKGKKGQHRVEAPPLAVGMAVRIHSLATQAQLNGRLGVCDAWDAGEGRWTIRFDDASDSDNEFMNVKPNNLEARVNIESPASVKTQPPASKLPGLLEVAMSPQQVLLKQLSSPSPSKKSPQQVQEREVTPPPDVSKRGQQPTPLKPNRSRELPTESPGRVKRSLSQDALHAKMSPKGQKQLVTQTPAQDSAVTSTSSVQPTPDQPSSSSRSPVQQHKGSEKEVLVSPSKRQRRIVEQALTPRRAHAARHALTPSRIWHETQDKEVDFAVLPGLFSGLESVLRLLSARNLKTYHSTVRTDVEATAGRDLTESRLAGILALAPGMIDVRWVGMGTNANLEIYHCAADGMERAPTVEEQSKRKELFAAALAAATEAGRIPRRALPARPEASSAPIKEQAVSGIIMPEIVAAKPASKGLTAAQRRENLLKRVQKREAAGESVETKEHQELCRKMQACDNAMIAHSVLQSLFARGEGKHSAASEAEVIKAMTSATSSCQSRRTLNRLDAAEAVQFLASRAESWFYVEAGVHNPDAKYLRRLPEGSAALALAALNTERKELDTQARVVCQVATEREEQIHAQQKLDDEAAERAAQSTVVQQARTPLQEQWLSLHEVELAVDEEACAVQSSTSACDVMEETQSTFVGHRLRKKTAWNPRPHVHDRLTLPAAK